MEGQPTACDKLMVSKMHFLKDFIFVHSLNMCTVVIRKPSLTLRFHSVSRYSLKNYGICDICNFRSLLDPSIEFCVDAIKI